MLATPEKKLETCFDDKVMATCADKHHTMRTDQPN